jgi:hypothetical protein
VNRAQVQSFTNALKIKQLAFASGALVGTGVAREGLVASCPGASLEMTASRDISRAFGHYGKTAQRSEAQGEF